MTRETQVMDKTNTVDTSTDKTVPLQVEFDNELAPQKNDHDGAANREMVIDRSHLQDTAIRVSLRTVQHGRLHNRPAVFVALHFSFIFYTREFRFTSAEILTKWHKRRATNDEALQPLEVRGLSPSKLYGAASREQRSWKYGIAVPVSATVGVAKAGIKPSVALESAFPRDHRLTISGFAIKGGAKWSIHENAKQGSGIPYVFTCAMLVPYDEENADSSLGCQASVSVVIRTSWPGVSLRAMPWRADDPVLFIPGHDKGTALSTTSFEDLTLADWELVVSYPTEFQVRWFLYP